MDDATIHCQRCRACGCRGDCANGCAWVAPDLCSRCDPDTRGLDPRTATAEMTVVSDCGTWLIVCGLIELSLCAPRATDEAPVAFQRGYNFVDDVLGALVGAGAITARFAAEMLKRMEDAGNFDPTHCPVCHRPECHPHAGASGPRCAFTGELLP